MGKGKFEVCTVCGIQNDTVEKGLCWACQRLPKKAQVEKKEELAKPAKKAAPLTSKSIRSKGNNK